MINGLFDHYESFKFMNSLIGRVYACTPQGPEAPKSETEVESQKTLAETLTTHTDSWYSYRELHLAKFLKRLCCCFKRRKWCRERIERYEHYL